MPQPSDRRARGRPARSAEEIADMRAHIAACALDLFHAEGYAAISMRRLAEAAGCTPRTLYKYFENKIDVLHTLWTEVFEEVFARLARRAAKAGDAKARLLAVSTGYVDYWLENRDNYFMVFMSGGISQADVSGYVGEGALVARFDLFIEVVRAALGPDAPADEVQTKAELLLCVLNGVAHNLITISGYPWTDAETLVAIAVEGLLTA